MSERRFEVKESIKDRIFTTQILRSLDRAFKAADSVMAANPEVSINVFPIDDDDLEKDRGPWLPQLTFFVDVGDAYDAELVEVEANTPIVGIKRALEGAVQRLSPAADQAARCRGCVFWHRNYWELRDGWGACKLRAPRVPDHPGREALSPSREPDTAGVFPATWHDDWCGEFKAAPAPESEAPNPKEGEAHESA
jgi:hypothetical protein